MRDIPQTLSAAIEKYDRTADSESVQRAKEQLDQVLQRFPRDHWPEMTLDEYALGQESSPENFCRWMEFVTTDLGSVAGGSASKHLIYKHREKPGWYFPSQFDSERDAWEKLRTEFVEAFELASNGTWDEIDNLDLLARASVLRLKALHCYFPKELLPVYSKNHLQHFIQLLNEQDKVPKSSSPLATNRHILNVLRTDPRLQHWTTKELERFLYWWNDPRDAHQVVKIAPGHKAKYWDDCLNGGYICVDWDQVGDLSQFESKETYRERFLQIFLDDPFKGNRSTAVRKSNEVWKLRQLEPGDLVVANQGTSKILGIGTVVEPGYQFREDRDEFKHCVTVNWDTQYEGQIPPQKEWAVVTVKKVSSDLFRKITTLGPTVRQTPVPPLYPRAAAALERKGQLILYGPPGTGKTYTARRLATWWLMRKGALGEAKAEADAVLGDSDRIAHCEKQLSTTQVARRVWWAVADPAEWSWKQLPQQGRVTFSYGRLRRNYALVQQGDLVIGYQSTPDKKISALARIVGTLSRRDDQESTIELEWVALVENGITYHELLADPVLVNSEPMRLRCQGTLFALTSSESDHLLSMLIERNPGLSLGEDSTEAEIGRLTRVTFHPSYTYEDFIEGYRPSEQGSGGLALHLEDGVFKRVCRAAQAHPDRTYLILVDEINRGNVAKILGELLTLLELDKRGLTVSLPQSKETFSIPPNVYLLGTMNTADRSIKLLDAALRRRFAFLELMPDVELLSGATVGELALDQFLEELNRRIAQSEGREKQIGHAYLLEDGAPVTDVESFASRFREEILPLLQEYCYDEYGTLVKFIGTGLVDAESQSLDQDKISDPEELVAALAEEFADKGSPVTPTVGE